MNEKPKMYFGHPVNVYNTHQEVQLVDIIKRAFPQYAIENPNQLRHQQGYQRFKKEQGNGMQYYFTQVLPNMAAGIFLPFEDDMFGAGVYGEAKFLAEHNKPIWEISFDGGISILKLSDSRALSIEETRKRVYK